MLKNLNKEEFKQLVFDFEKNEDWKYNGELPCIIDFYADWCMPCKMVAPVLERLAEEYDGQINIYKVNVEKEQELATLFGARSIPSLLFVPMKGRPMMQAGALPKESFDEIIKEIF